MGRMIDLTGKVFGRLTVLEYFDKDKHGNCLWRCQCNCKDKTIVYVTSSNLKFTISCGCYKIQRTKEVLKKYNKYDLSGDFGIGYTTNGQEFYFDLEDYDKIKDFCWNMQDGYVESYDSSTKKNISMHRVVMNYKVLIKNNFIDHIDRNPSNNRKQNLRFSTNSENMKNGNLKKNNNTGIIGVNKIKNKNIWTANARINGKKTNLGCYDNIFDAIIARLKAEKNFYGDFAPQKNLFEEYGI